MFHKVLTLFVVSVAISLFFVMPNDAFGVNTLKNVINFTGTYPAGVDEHDITLSTSLTNKSKAFSFITFRHATDNDASASFRSWEILNTTTIRIYGHSGTPANNDALDFVGYVIEYTNDSDVFVQHENFTLGASATEGERFRLLPTSINSSSSMILPSGIDFDGVNTFIGSEEFARYRIVNNTHWGWKVFDTPATGDNNIFAQIVDWNIPTVRVQTGNTTMISGGVKTVTQTPPIAVQNNQTMFIASYESDGATDEQSNRLMLYMQLQDDGDMVFNRDSTNFGKIIQWQLVEFLDSDMFMIHNGTCIAFGTLPECEEAGAKMASGTTTFDFPIPAVNTTTTIPFSPNAGGFGFSNGRLEGGDRGRIDSSMVTMELTSPTNVRMTRGASSEDGGWGMEVVTWGDVAGAGQIFDQDALDIATAVDQGTQFIINKTLADTATTSDAVILLRTIGLETNDTATVNDDTNVNVTKLVTDTATGSDQVDLNITKLVNDTATVTDQTVTTLTTVTNQTLIDTSTASDTIILEVTKIVSDAVTGVDEVQFNITKIITDTASTVDQVSTDVTAVFNQTETDTATGNDQVQITITKIVTDIASVVDLVDAEKVTDFQANATDTATITDAVINQLTRNQELLDIISTSDSIIVTFNTTIVTPPSGGGGGGGSSTPPNFQRIQGLQIQSEEFQVILSDTIPSEFIITWFGQETVGVSVTEIQPDPEFDTWFIIQPLPQDLDNAIEIDTSKVRIDPTRVTNIALQPYVLNVPSIRCNITLDPNVSCFDPILYEIPVDFTFNKGGFPFQTEHIVSVDGRSIVGACVVFGFGTVVVVCDFVNFLEVNWWWLASIAFILMVVSIIWKRGGTNLRVVRRISNRDLQSMSGEKIRRRKKFRKR